MRNNSGTRHAYQPHRTAGTGHASAVNQHTAKDAPWRSLVKALTYRLLGSAAMFVIFFVLSRSYTGRSLSQSLSDASIISVIDFVTKLVIYYVHERIWTNISWGKLWHKHYWESRNWRRRYRKMHDK
ncbi:MAG: DUF2061 domain-containing protein [Bacteroidales bacterium]